ncbi:MAG: hypothetical protein KDA41_05675, partial [Planctomycetales bacterium]|nr:hypothetical protein [Planctomycetales bacterium]
MRKLPCRSGFGSGWGWGVGAPPRPSAPAFPALPATGSLVLNLNPNNNTSITFNGSRVASISSELQGAAAVQDQGALQPLLAAFGATG